MSAGTRTGMRARLQDAWLHRGLLAWLLWPISLVYGALAAIRRSLYRSGFAKSGRLNVPVVVVGNLVAGGSGKTPVVMALVNHLRSRGLNPGVVSRGHGRAGDGCREVLATSQSVDVGDEPLLIARSCKVPVFVAARRIDAGRALLKSYPGTHVIVCDDGLQHYALARDIEICVFDRRIAGNGFLLPAGPLREPASRRTDLMLCDEAAPVNGAYRLTRTLHDHAVQADGTLVPLAHLAGRKLLAVAGIANPEAFFAMLRGAGLTLVQTLALPDHDDFNAWVPPGAGITVICTEKDAVKLWLRQPDALAVPLKLDLPTAFLASFDRLMDARLSSPHGPQTS